MKLWIDDVRPAPEGYVWCKSVEEAKRAITQAQSKYVRSCIDGSPDHSLHIQLDNNVTISNNKVWIDGKELPPVPVESTHSITQIDNDVYIDGYEFKRGKWRRTIKAIWHLLF